MVDIDAYFQRIGYRGTAAPTVETLRALHHLHPLAIPFENLSPVLGWPVPLDLPSLERKLIRERRGGYCYEQNTLFAAVLCQLGFQVRGLSARVLWNSPEDAITARSHMLLEVMAEGEAYLADVGFGGLTQTAPIRFMPGLEQETPHERFRLVQSGSYFHSQAFVKGAWKTVYRFELVEQFAPDYEIANYYVSTHPDSHFRLDLLVGRPAPGCRHVLFNNRYVVHHVNGDKESRVLDSAAEIRDVLAGPFGISVPEAAEFEGAMARILARGASVAQ